MINGTVDIFQYIVDYVYSFTPGDIKNPPHETLWLSGIYEVRETKEGVWESKKIKESTISKSIRIKIHAKCQRDGNRQAIISKYNQ